MSQVSSRDGPAGPGPRAARRVLRRCRGTGLDRGRRCRGRGGCLRAARTRRPRRAGRPGPAAGRRGRRGTPRAVRGRQRGYGMAGAGQGAAAGDRVVDGVQAGGADVAGRCRLRLSASADRRMTRSSSWVSSSSGGRSTSASVRTAVRSRPMVAEAWIPWPTTSPTAPTLQERTVPRGLGAVRHLPQQWRPPGTRPTRQSRYAQTGASGAPMPTALTAAIPSFMCGFRQHRHCIAGGGSCRRGGRGPGWRVEIPACGLGRVTLPEGEGLCAWERESAAGVFGTLP